MASGYYDITNKTLGKGHYGVVKLGRHCLTGEPVAIKIIEKSRLNPDSLNQLGTEIRILFRLSEFEHPNILKLYQTIDTEDKLYLVTEYCGPHACDLHDYLSRKHCRDGLSEIEAQIFFIQICSAISYCHSMGIVHRDLKPENILVTDYKHMNSKLVNSSRIHHNKNSTNNHHHHQQNYGQYPLLKLIDFGFANQWYPDEKMRTSCGTLAYSAPELLLGEPYDGTKVDVWGLGLMLYILLYGGNPFMQINDNETLTKILDCSFATPRRENVDFNAIELLRSLIKRNPETRLPIDAILEHKWFSSVPKTFEILLLKYKIKNHDSPLTGSASCSTVSQVSANAATPSATSPVQPLKQTPQQSKLTTPSQNVSSALPSISEVGPLKNLNRSLDDSTTCGGDTGEQATHKPKYNRTRSLSITRNHNKPNQQQLQTTSLTHTRSSINLERLNSGQHLSTPSRSHSIYRPTSPDVGGSAIAPTEDESRLHDNVVQEMFRLTKYIDSKFSIEASLKNARFTHRQFNQNSIQPAVINRRKLALGLERILGGNRKNDEAHSMSSPSPIVSKEATTTASDEKPASNNVSDKSRIINTKLSNDDYIYATYQLTRDKILRFKERQVEARTKDLDKESAASIPITNHGAGSQTDATIKESRGGGALDRQTEDQLSAKENEDSARMVVHQRKLLQPQHKMRDKFTSFFRSESTSPSGSFGVSCDSQAPGDSSLRDQVNYLDAHHEAFNDHDNEHSISSRTYYTNKAEIQDNSLAYALPLARKCSLVSEESGCSNEPADS